MMKTIAQFQIGKARLTQGVLDSLQLACKNHHQIRISVLKSSGRTRDTMRILAENIIRELTKKTGFVFNLRIIGFTIVLLRGPKQQ